METLTDLESMTGAIFDVIRNGMKKQEQYNGGEKNMALQDDVIRQIVFEIIENNPAKKSADIAIMVNEHVEKTRGVNPRLTDCQVRAYKYWHRVENEEKARA
jgi:hypothetical protein